MAQPHLKIVKPQTEAEKITNTTTDTREVTPDIVRSWLNPPFQRPLRENAKVLAVTAEIKETEVIPGSLTLGVLDGKTYLIDGQHRCYAFLKSELAVGYVDVRIAHYKTMAEMAAEFWKLNSRISTMKPDDYLRALEASTPLLARLRRRCPFVAYGNIRRDDKGPVLSMSSALRCWRMSSKDCPTGATASITQVESLETDQIDELITFLETALAAFGKDAEYHRLWGNLNLTLCMWLYRRTVLGAWSTRSVRLTDDLFRKCMVALSADDTYLEWLRSRSLNETTRSPGYRRVKEIFARRLTEELGQKPLFPNPDWVVN